MFIVPTHSQYLHPQLYLCPRSRFQVQRFKVQGSAPLAFSLSRSHALTFSRSPRLSGFPGQKWEAIVVDRSPALWFLKGMRVDGFAEAIQPFRCAFRGRHPDKTLWPANGFSPAPPCV